jgi:hypothetical protein
MSGFPRLDAYLAALPGGLSAYPDCLAKGTIIRAMVTDGLGAVPSGALPPELARLLEDLPMGSEWVPEVQVMGLMYGLADASGLSDEGLIAANRARDRRTFESPAYRVLMAVATPGLLMRNAAGRWATFHRGSTLEVEGIADDGVRIGLRFPRALFDGLHLRCFGGAFVSALELSNARAPRADIVEACPGYARFRVAWE